MCELFAMSSRYPATVNLSLSELARHGGLTDHHKDGWGIAYYQGGDVQLVRDDQSAYDSQWLKFVKAHNIHSTRVISHIRKATQGEVTLRNTQPYSCALGGRRHVFVHNGNLVGLDDAKTKRQRRFEPVGDTDSELAFCLLLERLAPLWDAAELPSLDTRRQTVASFAADIRPLGPANFLYCDGDVLFAHGHKRTQTDKHVGPPGLTRLRRHCPVEAMDTITDAVSIRHGGGQQDITLFASVPLTDEEWLPMDEGELLVAQNGELLP